MDRQAVYVRCGHLLPRIASAHLDCVSDTLALLLAARGVADVLSPFGCDWRFELVPAQGRLGVALPPPDLGDRLAERTGYRPLWTTVGRQAVEQWHQALSEGAAVSVVADAYHLPWVPYAGHEHMEHGFVVEGLAGSAVYVVDPYDNATEWGRAVPQCLETSLATLEPALRDARWCVLKPTAASDPIDPIATVVGNARAIAASGEEYQAFAAQYAVPDEAALHHLALQTWLLQRNRALHAQWLATNKTIWVRTTAADRFAPVPQAWQRAAESAYLALRRVRTGRAVPAGAKQSLQHALDTERAAAAGLLDACEELMAELITTGKAGLLR
jgi:hypothetical protein